MKFSQYAFWAASIIIIGGAFYFGAIEEDLPSQPVKEQTGFITPISFPTEKAKTPSSFTYAGKQFEPAKLQSPLVNVNEKAADADVATGREIYFKNCVHCHGAKLDGNGLYAPAQDPKPANFLAKDSVTALSDQHLFWRIATGSEGLKASHNPWLSLMPAWLGDLSEKEIWQVITYLRYSTAKLAGYKNLDASKATINTIFTEVCASCHGEKGLGDGPAANYLYPKPRTFELGVFKYRTSALNDDFPADQDIASTIRRGLQSTSMPSWADTLTEPQIQGLVQYIKTLGEWEEEQGFPSPVLYRNSSGDRDVPKYKGHRHFKKMCESCHGIEGRGNVTTTKILKDDWQDRIWPRNLTKPHTFRWARNADSIYHIISIGIQGTPMPEHMSMVTPEARWAAASFVQHLIDEAEKPIDGRAIIESAKVVGELPTNGWGAAWKKATPVMTRLIPNLIASPKIYSSLPTDVVIRTLYNESHIVFRLDIDDPTPSIPGSIQERMHAKKEIKAISDASAIHFAPTANIETGIPFLAGQSKHQNNKVMTWRWKAQQSNPPIKALTEATLAAQVLAKGSEILGHPLEASGVWQDGQWRIFFKWPLSQTGENSLTFGPEKYYPIAFSNWDGWDGQEGNKRSITPWHWLKLQKKSNSINAQAKK